VATRPDRTLTYEDYLHFPEGERYELIDGEAWMVPSPNARHQDIAGRMYRRVGNFLEAHRGGRVFIAPFDVVLSSGDVLQPDLVFIAEGDLDVLTEANVWGRPSWVAEVLSQDVKRDRVLKLQRYERFSVPEVWIADPVDDLLEVYRLKDGRYPDPTVLRPPAVAQPLAPGGLGIDLAYVFRR
jgi:Uma2 family endonuclease